MLGCSWGRRTSEGSVRAGTAPAPAPAAGHAPAPERLGPRPLLFQPKTRLVWPLQLLIFGVQGIFWLGDQSLGGSPSTQGDLGWGLSECLGLRKAVLGSPLCFNIYLSTKTSPTSFPARRRMEEPTPGPGKGKHPESSAQREPALGTKGFRSRETLLGVWKAMWAGGWMLPCPKAPTPVQGIPSPAAGTASCILGVQEEAHQHVWGTAESLRGCRVSRCSGHRRMLRLRRKERSKPCLGIGVWSRGGAGCSTRLHSACGEAGGGQGRWPAVFAGRGLESIKAAL